MNLMKVVHTSDWQLGKVYRQLPQDKVSLLTEARFEAVRKTVQIANEQQADYVLVAGDTFDSDYPDQETTRKFFAALNELQVPMLMIAGNHDYAKSNLWQSKFFKKNLEDFGTSRLKLLFDNQAYIDEKIVLFPCSLSFREQVVDSRWITEAIAKLSEQDVTKPRIALAHGSITGFGDENNNNNLEKLLDIGTEIDYYALGDWHGFKQVSDSAFYSGTLEQDRFDRSANYDAGNILIADIARGAAVKVVNQKIGKYKWQRTELSVNENVLNQIEKLLHNLDQNTLCKIKLSGKLNSEQFNEIKTLCNNCVNKFHINVDSSQVEIVPQIKNILERTESGANPLLKHIAQTIDSELNDTDKPHNKQLLNSEIDLYIQYLDEVESTS